MGTYKKILQENAAIVPKNVTIELKNATIGPKNVTIGIKNAIIGPLEPVMGLIKKFCRKTLL